MKPIGLKLVRFFLWLSFGVLLFAQYWMAFNGTLYALLYQSQLILASFILGATVVLESFWEKITK